MLPWLGRRMLAGILVLLQAAALSSPFSVAGEWCLIEAEAIQPTEPETPAAAGSAPARMPSGHPERLVPAEPLSGQEIQVLQQLQSRRWARLAAAFDQTRAS